MHSGSNIDSLPYRGNVFLITTKTNFKGNKLSSYLRHLGCLFSKYNSRLWRHLCKFTNSCTGCFLFVKRGFLKSILSIFAKKLLKIRNINGYTVNSLVIICYEDKAILTCLENNHKIRSLEQQCSKLRHINSVISYACCVSHSDRDSALWSHSDRDSALWWSSNTLIID